MIQLISKIFNLIKVFTWNYGHGILNIKIQIYFSKGIRNSTRKDLEVQEPFLRKMLNLQSLCRIMGMKKIDLMVYITICILPFSFFFLLPQNIVQVDKWSKRIQSWTQRYSWTLLITLSWMWIMNSRFMLHH